VFVGLFDRHLDDVSRLEAAGVAEVDFAVDFRRIGLGAAGGAAGFFVDCVDEDIEGRTDLGGELVVIGVDVDLALLGPLTQRPEVLRSPYCDNSCSQNLSRRQ